MGIQCDVDGQADERGSGGYQYNQWVSRARRLARLMHL